MPPYQRVFTIVPDSPHLRRNASDPAKPPMTSKQAQKLYRDANRVPRLSKADERRLEKQRQDEIKKELDRDRTLAKARAAREKKKAKEDDMREVRRKNGQPTVACRPSQATISVFLRGNGTSKKRDSEGTVLQPDIPPDSDSSEQVRDVHGSQRSIGLAGRLPTAAPGAKSHALSRFDTTAPQAESPGQQSNTAPPSTQAFVLELLDDMFPTASQLAQELEEEGTQSDKVSSEISGQPGASEVPIFCSQDLELSSQDLRELEAPVQCQAQPTESDVPTSRFFTSSGNNERLAVAIMRSRRAANRYELTRWDTQRRAQKPGHPVSELERTCPNQVLSEHLHDLSNIDWDDDNNDF